MPNAMRAGERAVPVAKAKEIAAAIQKLPIRLRVWVVELDGDETGLASVWVSGTMSRKNMKAVDDAVASVKS